MKVNAKMISVETVPGIMGGRMGESCEGGESKYDIFKNLCKCYNVPHPAQQ
jgi:hypothetical protein